MLFPTYDVFRVQGFGGSALLVRGQGEGRLLVGIGIKSSDQVYNYLNADLEVQEIRPSDGFLQEHKRLYQEGILDHPFDPAELEDWRKVVRFSMLPDGNSPEVGRLFQEINQGFDSVPVERNRKSSKSSENPTPSP